MSKLLTRDMKVGIIEGLDGIFRKMKEYCDDLDDAHREHGQELYSEYSGFMYAVRQKAYELLEDKEEVTPDKKTVTIEEAFGLTVRFLKEEQKKVKHFKIEMENLVSLQNYESEEDFVKAFNELLEWSREQ